MTPDKYREQLQYTVDNLNNTSLDLTMMHRHLEGVIHRFLELDEVTDTIRSIYIRLVAACQALEDATDYASNFIYQLDDAVERAK